MDELFLKVNSVGGYYNAPLVAEGPQDGWREVGEGFADAGGSLDNGDSILVEGAGDGFHHGELLGAVLEIGKFRRKTTGFAEKGVEYVGFDWSRRSGKERLYYHANVGAGVIYNVKADACFAVHGGNADIGAGGLEVTGWMIVNEDLAGKGILGGSWYGVLIAEGEGVHR